MAKGLGGVVLREFRVRPIRDSVERAFWNNLMEAHYCLGFRGPFGTTLRNAAESLGGEWATLVVQGVQGGRTGALDGQGVGPAVPSAAPDRQ